MNLERLSQRGTVGNSPGASAGDERCRTSRGRRGGTSGRGRARSRCRHDGGATRVDLVPPPRERSGSAALAGVRGHRGGEGEDAQGHQGDDHQRQ